ncbi:MAG: cbb3-type cytochrome c oxidase subunit I [Anaerolineae bacterium]|nr:MAG: cbb3-type cytochrome c oxidase subunit I [Anaerolineae bacterium]
MDTNTHELPAYGQSDRAVLRVSLIYMLTGFVLFLIMGLLGLVMRLDHAGWYVVSRDAFYRIMTVHGAGMVGGMLLAAMGGMSAALARTVKLSVRWLWAAYFIYSLSVPFLLYAVIIGKYAGGWTSLDPLPFHGLTWEVWAGVMMYLAFLSIGVGFATYCLPIFLRLSRKYGGIGGALAWRYLFSRGPVDPKLQIPNAVEVAGMATSIIGLITALGGVLVLFPLFGKAGGVVANVDPLYSKNLIMLFGHAIANNTMYVSVGLVYALLPVFTRRGGHTSRLIVLAWNMTIVLVFTPISHHLYQDFAQPLGLQILGQVASWTIAPEVLLITIIGSMAHIYRSGMRWTVPSILIVLGFWGWVFGGLAAIIDASLAVNNLTHNTLWVPAHFHTYYLLGATSFVWAYLFYLVGDLGGIVERPASRIAAWIYGLGGVGFILMFFFAAADSVPRRYAIHLPEWQIFAKIAVPFVLLITLSLLWLIADMARAIGPAWRNVKSPKAPLAS